MPGMSKELRLYLWSIDSRRLQSSLLDACSELDKASRFLLEKEDYAGSTEFYTISCYLSSLVEFFAQGLGDPLIPLRTFDISLTTVNLIPVAAHRRLHLALVIMVDALGDTRFEVQFRRYHLLKEFDNTIETFSTLIPSLYDSWEVLKNRYKPELPRAYTRPGCADLTKITRAYQEYKIKGDK